MEKIPPKLIVNAIVLQYENVLLVKREINKQEQWVFPGIELFSGQPLVTCLQEAVENQTGYQIQEAGIYQVYDVFPQENDEHFVVMDFEAKATGGDLKIGDDVLDVAWVSHYASKSMDIEANVLELLIDMNIFAES